MLIIFIIILECINSVKEISSFVAFPFVSTSFPLIKYYNQNNKNKIYDHSNFFNDNYNLRLFSSIKIGNPPQDIIIFFNTINDILFIGELPDIPENIFPPSLYRGYQLDKSSSFINKTLSQNKYLENENIFFGEENLCLYTNIENIKKQKYSCFSNFTFAMVKKISKDNNASNCLILGLLLNEKNYEINFINQIKNKKIISSYLYSFEYHNDTEGLFVIGQYPHEYSPELYKNKELKEFYPDKPSMASFGITFDVIYTYINNEKLIIENNAKSNLLVFNMGLIVGTNEYLKFIENSFFNQFIYNDICRKNYVGTGWEDYIIISCKDDINSFNIEKFPSLFFNIKSINNTFELTFEDLFKKINNRYYFNIIFENYDTNIWRIGKPFILKYNFVYNGEAKTIGFYKKNNDIIFEKKNNNNNKKFKLELNALKIFIIIILLFIFISLAVIFAYYLGKKFNLIRKKHANELIDDNYEYISSFLNNKYKLSKKDINEKNNEKNEQTLEMRDETKFK